MARNLKVIWFLVQKNCFKQPWKVWCFSLRIIFRKRKLLRKEINITIVYFCCSKWLSSAFSCKKIFLIGKGGTAPPRNCHVGTRSPEGSFYSKISISAIHQSLAWYSWMQPTARSSPSTMKIVCALYIVSVISNWSFIFPSTKYQIINKLPTVIWYYPSWN